MMDLNEQMQKLQIEHPRTLGWPMLVLTDAGQTACVMVRTTEGSRDVYLRESEVQQVFDWCKQWLRKGLPDD